MRRFAKYSKNLISMRNVMVKINGKQIDVPEGMTIYDASNEVLSKYERIPTICYHPYLSADGNCRVCLVEDSNGTLVSSCNTSVVEGMEYFTNTSRVNDNIKNVLKFLLSSHPLDCPTCEVNGVCTFQDLLAKYDVDPQSLGAMQEVYLENTMKLMEVDEKVFGNNALILDRSKCVKCTRCIRACTEIQEMNILGMKKRGNHEEISVFNDMENFEGDDIMINCISCGQCTFVCPTGAIRVNSDVPKVTEWLKTRSGVSEEDLSEVILVAQTAPAVRVTFSEDLGLAPGALSDEQMVAGLKALGFDYVFDTNFTADLTIMEEGHELLARLESGGPFPMFTSCCPAWINMAEKVYPEFLDNLSTCKSPQQMMGPLIKEYWAEKVGIDKSKVKVVSIMPCTAKKDECVRPDLDGDVDVVLSTRELARLFTLHNVKVGSLDAVPYDDPLGESTGAAVIFGATGGVMEAAVRTAYEVVVGEPLPGVDYKPARGFEGIKEADVDVGGITLKIAIAHQGKNIHKLMEGIKSGEKEYHFVEIMCCPGGCLGGGGNPKFSNSDVTLQDRMDAIYNLDANMEARKSHVNESVLKLYEDFLGAPLGEKSHQLLHTHYKNRKDN